MSAKCNNIKRTKHIKKNLKAAAKKPRILITTTETVQGQLRIWDVLEGLFQTEVSTRDVLEQILCYPCKSCV